MIENQSELDISVNKISCKLQKIFIVIVTEWFSSYLIKTVNAKLFDNVRPVF